MIRAGNSILAAIEGIAEQTKNPRFKFMLLRIKQDVEAGKQFSDAVAKHPKHFNPPVHQYGPRVRNVWQVRHFSRSTLPRTFRDMGTSSGFGLILPMN